MRALRVGLTGGIGAGKSLATAALARLGADVVDVDEIARAQGRPGGAAYGKIVKAFGTADRKKLAALVFKNGAARKKLERITHPLVLREMERRLKKAKNLAVAAIPLLFETNLQKKFDVTLNIEAPVATRRRRVLKRDRSNAAAVWGRMRAQLTDEARRSRADVTLFNAGEKRQFLSQVREYYRALALLRHGAAA